MGLCQIRRLHLRKHDAIKAELELFMHSFIIYLQTLQTMDSLKDIGYMEYKVNSAPWTASILLFC